MNNKLCREGAALSGYWIIGIAEKNKTQAMIHVLLTIPNAKGSAISYVKTCICICYIYAEGLLATYTKWSCKQFKCTELEWFDQVVYKRSQIYFCPTQDIGRRDEGQEQPINGTATKS